MSISITISISVSISMSVSISITIGISISTGIGISISISVNTSISISISISIRGDTQRRAAPRGTMLCDIALSGGQAHVRAGHIARVHQWRVCAHGAPARLVVVVQQGRVGSVGHRSHGTVLDAAYRHRLRGDACGRSVRHGTGRILVSLGS
jgi:hypothetical protein